MRRQRNHRVTIEQAPNSKYGRQYSQHPNKWSHKQDVSGIAPERSTVTKWHAEQNQWTDVHTKTNHPNARKTRIYQRKHVVAEVRTVHKNDQGPGPFKNDEQQRNTATIPRTVGNGLKDIFLWAIGHNAITEMTKTVREREPSSLPLYKLYTLFRLHFTPERNVQHSRADFFDLKQEDGESAADVWKRILEVEENGEFAAELLASKFLSVIGKSTGDYDLKKKIRKSDMSVEAITEALHK